MAHCLTIANHDEIMEGFMGLGNPPTRTSHNMPFSGGLGFVPDPSQGIPFMTGAEETTELFGGSSETATPSYPQDVSPPSIYGLEGFHGWLHKDDPYKDRRYQPPNRPRRPRE